MKLYELLVRTNLSKFDQFFKGSEAATLTDKDAEKMTISIRANLLTLLHPLKYLTNDYDCDFTIKRWMEDETQSLLFITAPLAKQVNTLTPLMSGLFALSMQELMGLGESQTRRIWFVIDELPAFNKIPKFEQSLAQLRKYGGCILAAAQDLGQISSLYGQDLCRSILSNFNTLLVFSNNNNTSSQYLANELGHAQTKEVNENRSISPHAFRDGKQLQERKESRSLVSATDITMLNMLEYFLKLPGSYPITKHKAKIDNMPNISTAYEQGKKIGIQNIAKVTKSEATEEKNTEASSNESSKKIANENKENKEIENEQEKTREYIKW